MGGEQFHKQRNISKSLWAVFFPTTGFIVFTLFHGFPFLTGGLGVFTDVSLLFWTLLSPSGFWVEMQPADVGLILTGKRGIRLQRQLKLRSRRAADFPEQLPDPLKNTLPSGTCEPLIRTHRTSAGNEPPPPSPPSAARFVWELHPSVLVLCEQRLFLGGGGWEMEVKRKKRVV